MQRLYPPPPDGTKDAEIEVGEVYRADLRRPEGRLPWVALDMVTSVDGAVSIDDRSGGLSGPGDRELFHALRAVADVILVGAGTVRAENYGPPRTSEDDQRRRVERGQAPFPRIAVVSGTLDLDPAAKLFRGSPTQPIVFTTEHADARRRADLGEVAEVVSAGHTLFDPHLALRHLRDQVGDIVICEGGPTLNGALLTADVVDEVCVTLTPLMASGNSARLARGLHVDPPLALRLDRVIEDDGFLFLRYLRG